jgi:hypothetical protein
MLDFTRDRFRIKNVSVCHYSQWLAFSVGRYKMEIGVPMLLTLTTWNIRRWQSESGLDILISGFGHVVQ